MKIFITRLSFEYRMVTLRFFSGTVRQKTFDGKTLYPPSYPYFNLATRTFLKHKGPPYGCFRTVRQKVFDKKTWHHLLNHSFLSRPERFWNTTVPHRKVSVPWDQEIWKNLEAPIPLLLCIKVFITWIFRNTEAFPKGCLFAIWVKKFQTENVIPSLLSMKYFAIPEHFLNTTVSPPKIFGTVRPRNSKKPWCPHPSSYAWKFLLPEFFETLKHSPEVVFLQSESKTFRRKTWYPPCYPWSFFPYQNISEIQG